MSPSTLALVRVWTMTNFSKLVFRDYKSVGSLPQKLGEGHNKVMHLLPVISAFSLCVCTGAKKQETSLFLFLVPKDVKYFLRQDSVLLYVSACLVGRHSHHDKLPLG